jgi:hypothetical protein
MKQLLKKHMVFVIVLITVLLAMYRSVMIKFSRMVKITTYLLLFFTIYNPLSAQLNVDKNSFHYPKRMHTGEWQHEFNFSLAALPEDFVEEVSTMVYAPLLAYQGKYSLPSGFIINGSARTNFIVLHLISGLKWTYQYKRYGFGIGYDFSYLYGRLDYWGFKSKINGWLSSNIFQFGIAFNKFSLTFISESSYNLGINKFTDNIQISGDDQFILAGTSLSVYIEQPFWKNNFLSVGFKANYARFYYPLWIVFPTWERYYFIPEVIIGFIL